MSKRLDRVVVGCVILMAFTAIIPAAAEPMPGELVDVGTHRLYIHCSGSGRPSIVLEAGLGGMALEWEQVQTDLARDYRVCSYDRAGMGRSEAGPLPRTSDRLVEELHRLLSTAGVPPPYVLVGHSFGGYTVQLFASRYPELTAGLILDEASHPQQIARFAEPPVGVNIAPRGRIMFLVTPGVPAQLPPEQRVLADRLTRTYKARFAVTRELEGFRASAEQVSAAGPLPEVPLLVLTRGIQKWPDDDRGNLKEALWQRLQTELARSTPLGAQIIARRSGHYIHLDQPGLVAQAVQIVATVSEPAVDHLVRLTRLRDELARLDGQDAQIRMEPVLGALAALR